MGRKTYREEDSHTILPNMCTVWLKEKLGVDSMSLPLCLGASFTRGLTPWFFSHLWMVRRCVTLAITVTVIHRYQISHDVLLFEPAQDAFTGPVSVQPIMEL